MRMRHIAKTDPLMDGDRKQVSFRLSGHFRQRIKEVRAENLPDLHSESDIMQDMVWLWFHEYDLMAKKGLVNANRSGRTGESRDRVHGGPSDQAPEQQVVEVGVPT